MAHQLQAAPLTLLARRLDGTPTRTLDQVTDEHDHGSLLIVDDADLCDVPLTTLLPQQRAWANRTNTTVVVTVPSACPPPPPWHRHCDLVLSLTEPRPCDLATGGQRRVEVRGPDGAVLGQAWMDFEGHLTR